MLRMWLCLLWPHDLGISPLQSILAQTLLHGHLYQHFYHMGLLETYLCVLKPAAASGTSSGREISKWMFKDRKWTKKLVLVEGFRDILLFSGDQSIFYLNLKCFQIFNSNACGDQCYSELKHYKYETLISFSSVWGYTEWPKSKNSFLLRGIFLHN